ncbi:MAG: P1 family peptidase [Anaerovoracaceae bacterium]|jgi:D-aminopeptidase
MGLPKNSGLNLSAKYAHGRRNLITDVEGVKIGSVTIRHGDVNTGVTAVKPHSGNLFLDKVTAGASVINGFGKSIGILQLLELGTIETPIILTNTLSIGTAFTALTKYMLAENPDIGVKTGTVNCIITECNDGPLNDIRGLHVEEKDIFEALEKAGEDFEEGAVGGGTGMTCLGLKGGIGSASRIVSLDSKEFTIGSLVMTNFGMPGNLRIGGTSYDTRKKSPADTDTPPDRDQGSCIIILATDLPMSSRQLNRVAKRAAVSLGRTGSFIGNGSGDIAIAFSTANRIPHYSSKSILDVKMIHDDTIDPIFEASVEATEEAIISSLYHAETTTGIRNTTFLGLRDFLGKK